MKYILNVDTPGLTIDLYKRSSYIVKEIPIEVVLKYKTELQNITLNHVSTKELNEQLGTNYQVHDFTSCLDIGDILYIIKTKDMHPKAKVTRAYKIEITGDPENIIRRPEMRHIDEIIEKCNAYNAEKAQRNKDGQESKSNDRSWITRDYFNRLDRAYQLYDETLMNTKATTYSNLSYKKRCLEKDLDLAYKRACDAGITIEEIREVEVKVLEERLRRIKNGIKNGSI